MYMILWVVRYNKVRVPYCHASTGSDLDILQ